MQKIFEQDRYLSFYLAMNICRFTATFAIAVAPAEQNHTLIQTVLRASVIQSIQDDAFPLKSPPAVISH